MIRLWTIRFFWYGNPAHLIEVFLQWSWSLDLYVFGITVFVHQFGGRRSQSNGQEFVEVTCRLKHLLTPFFCRPLQTVLDCHLSLLLQISSQAPRGIFAFGSMENGSWVRLVFCVVVVLFVCLFVCLLEFFVFLNRNFSFSNGLFCLYSLHQVPCDNFLGGGAGRGGRGWCGEERNGVNIKLRMEKIWLEKRLPINQLICQWTQLGHLFEVAVRISAN